MTGVPLFGNCVKCAVLTCKMCMKWDTQNYKITGLDIDEDTDDADFDDNHTIPLAPL